MSIVTGHNKDYSDNKYNDFSNKKTVFLKKCKNYEISKIREVLNEGIEKLGCAIEGKKILIKPNLLSDMEAKRHATSQKEFIIALFDILKERNCEIFIGDSPALVKAYDVLKKLDLIEEIKRYNAQIVEFKGMDENHIWLGVKEYDNIINLCKLKTHSLMTYTGAVKNLYGLVPGKTKALLHPIHPNPMSFGKLIYDIYEEINPQINIIDAIISMEGNGPSNGNLKKTGFIGISNDALALDLVIMDLINFKNTAIQKIAGKKRAPFVTKNGDLDYKKIYLTGDEIEKIKDFKKPIKGTSILSIFLPQKARTIVSSVISRKPVPTLKCVACKKCVEMCPVKAIKIKEIKVKEYTKKIAKVDYSKCIKCYCCHEVCPYGAIKISFFERIK